MIHRFRRRMIGRLIIFWLVIMAAAIVIRTVAWNRLSHAIGLSPEMNQATHEARNLMSAMTWVVSLLGIGAAVIAWSLYRLDCQQERVQHDLLEAKLQAEEAVRVKSAFLANMSHEIRSPMNAILGFSELLEPEGLTPKQSQYVRAIRDSGAALLQLINDILDLSKLEAGKLELHPSPTDMRDSCEFLRTVFAEQALKKSLQLQFELSPDLPRAVLLDRLRLRQVLVNLLGNAIKFTERGHVKTRVSWQAGDHGSDGTLLIDVEDTGIGIPREKIEEIFQPFVQADTRRDVTNQGTGIGLTIVKRLIEMMTGTLTVESTIGEGSVFHLRFSNVPVSVRLPVGDHAEPGGAVDFDDLVSASLLIVDDNEANRDLMKGMFEKTHHRLHFANNGLEALDFLDKAKVDLVMLDLRMPVMDGRTALAEMRRRPALTSLPVIAVTASSQDSEDEEIRREFNGYVRKPFSRQTLFLALAEFLQRAPSGDLPKERVFSKTVGPALAPLPEHATEWRALAVRLGGLEAGEWPGLHASLAVNETRAFAHKLSLLGDAAHCDGVIHYAATLTQFADAYAVGEMERHLERFPTLVESIKRSVVELT